MDSPSDSRSGTQDAIDVVRSQLAEATGASKCHGCGCLHKTLEALEGTSLGRGALASDLARARAVFEPKKYDCLGCAVCYPAIAANAYAEAFPTGAESLDLCPTESPEERAGWPPLPGDYHVVRYDAPVAVCTLNSAAVAAQLARRAPPGLSIVGSLHTENLGIERLVRNVLGNPHIRRLVVCGEDTRQAIGHLPGQSLVSLFSAGLDEHGRIRGARGKRPVLKNISRDQVEVFLRQIQLVSRIGETDTAVVEQAIAQGAAAAPGRFEETPADLIVPTVQAADPVRLVTDPAGYCVVYPDLRRGILRLEHFQNDGSLDCVVEGRTPASVYAVVIERGLVSRLDHAAYLGRELARAERSLANGEPYVQDRAAGEVEPPGSCGCPGPKEGTCETR